MENQSERKIVIDGTEYNIEDFNDSQKTMINHILNVEQKISEHRFQLEQLTVTKTSFFNMLKETLTKKEEVVELTEG